MTKEKVQEAVVEETEVVTAEVEVAEVTEEITEDTAATDKTANADEDELSPWYYFFAQGCGWCKKANPVVDALNDSGKHPEILMLDVAESDNAKLRDELFAEYNTRCGTPWFVNADTGKGICGFRDTNIIEKWLNGEDIPVPLRPTGPPPKPPFHGSTNKEDIAWKKEYKKWLKNNKHLGDDWKSKQKSADNILEAPRPYSDPPRPPLGPDMNEKSIDNWGREFTIWQEKNSHLPNLAPVAKLVENFKARLAGGGNIPPRMDNPVGPETNVQINSLGAKVEALEIKVDKIIAHFGIK